MSPGLWAKCVYVDVTIEVNLQLWLELWLGCHIRIIRVMLKDANNAYNTNNGHYTQLYLHSRRDDMMSTIHRLKNHITDVGQWMSANWLKLNTEKTELLWAGSRHSQSSVTVCCQSLQLAADTVTAQDNVRLLEVTISSDWVCSAMCLTCPQQLFTGCISSYVSDDHSTLSQRLHLFTNSWPPALTSAMPYMPEPRSLSLTLCSMLWTLPHVSSVTQESSTMAWLKYCMMTYTGSCGRSSNVQTRCHHAQTSA